MSGSHYPIEIQYNTYYDRQFNNWLHKYIYKKEYNNSVGCVALRITHGKHLSEVKRKIEQTVGYEKIQLVTISRPSAYGEYEPYHFVDTKEEFAEAVEQM